ncbi:hypothetical protein D3C72_1581180 [compost metagenome]
MTSSRSASGKKAKMASAPCPTPRATRPPMSPVNERMGNGPSLRSRHTASNPLRTNRKMLSPRLAHRRSSTGRHRLRRSPGLPALAARAKKSMLRR